MFSDLTVKEEVIPVIGAGLLLITMAGFAFTGVLVDQIEKFFRENRKEETQIEETQIEETETGES